MGVYVIRRSCGARILLRADNQALLMFQDRSKFGLTAWM